MPVQGFGLCGGLCRAVPGGLGLMHGLERQAQRFGAVKAGQMQAVRLCRIPRGQGKRQGGVGLCQPDLRLGQAFVARKVSLQRQPFGARSRDRDDQG